MSRTEPRTYSRVECVSFRKTSEQFGGLSNMAPGFPLEVNGVAIRNSEALYQACRFPHLPEVQRLIVDETSPITAKMKSKPYRSQSRPDWDAVRVTVMRWCLRVKLAQNWEKFGALLLDTGDRPIVEDSRKDDFWGALELERGKLVGANVLGRLLMELREQLRGVELESLRRVEPPAIAGFLLYAEPIGVVEGRGRLGSRVSDSLPLSRRTRGAEQRVLSMTTTAVDPQSERAVQAPSDSAGLARAAAKAYPKRLIEVDLPIKRISKHARREKSIRHGHISTLHIWWARRPLAACRAVILAALWPDPADPFCPERFRKEAADRMRDFRDKRGGKQRNWDDPLEVRAALLDFIADFANWDNSNEEDYLTTSRVLVQVAHQATTGNEGRPLVIDPFAGGGAMPLEALRIGADAFASDLNPVAVLLNKVVLEHVPRFGPQLAEEVRRWGKWLKDEAEKELSRYYPKGPDGAAPIAYLWARTVRCEGPSCGAMIPLFRSPWLAHKTKRGVALAASGGSKKTIVIEIDAKASPQSVCAGTSKGGAVTCPLCGFTTSVEQVRSQLSSRQGGNSDARLLAVVEDSPKGRAYRTSAETDVAAVSAARRRWEKMVADTADAGPREPLNHLRGFFNVVLYGMRTWGDLFTPRQLLALTTFWSLLRDRLPVVSELSGDPAHLAALQTTLACVLGRATNAWSAVCRWHNVGEKVEGTFSRQALPMVWDFVEANPFSSSSGNFIGAVDWVADVCDSLVCSHLQPGQAAQADAAKHPLPDDCADLLATDPPYYDAVPYADLSDFFYVWLRRYLASVHEDLFTTPVTPKDEECVTLAHRAAMYRNKDRRFFETKLGRAVADARRVLRPTGCGVVVFANKSTEGWEAALSALVDAGWVITASWPIDTEMGVRLRAQGSAVLGSSVHLVCRPRENPDGSVRTDAVGDWRDVLAELPQRIHGWLPRLANEGVVGADAIFACLGPALEVFSRYSRVEKASGEQVTLKEYLEQVWAAVAKEALNMIFTGADTTGFEEDARLTAMWLWTLSAGANGADASNGSAGEDDAEDDDEDEAPAKKGKAAAGFVLEYDAARKIAQGLGAHLENLTSLVEVNGSTARLLPVAERTRSLFGNDDASAPATKRRKKKKQQLSLGFAAELEEAEESGGWGDKGVPAKAETVLSRIHQSMILFAAGRGEALKRFLVDEGVGSDERFWRLAQALSALYPSSTDEKRWVDGVLARKKSLGF